MLFLNNNQTMTLQTRQNCYVCKKFIWSKKMKPIKCGDCIYIPTCPCCLSDNVTYMVFQNECTTKILILYCNDIECSYVNFDKQIEEIISVY